MSRARATSRKDWPTHGPHLQLLQRLDDLRETLPARPSFRTTAAVAGASHEAVRSWLTGTTLPTAQELGSLVTALGGGPDDRDEARGLHEQVREAKRDSVRGERPRADGVEVEWRARARKAGCTVWAMGEFTPATATVHTAIGRRIAPPEQPGDAAPPAYVARAHDPNLRADIDAAAASKLRALIVLRGTSSTGKTRSLFEAVHARCQGWAVLRPRDAAAARALPESGMFDRPIVVWLNELQDFLGPNGQGLTTHVLDDLYYAAQAPLVVVGTLWPEKVAKLTGEGRDDTRSEAHELLTGGSAVRWHDVTSTLTTSQEKAAARELARTDPRVARALQDPDRVGFAQTLAGAHELLEHYRSAPTMARQVLDAAADARRLGHTHALTPDLLRALAQALWDDRHAPTLPPTPENGEWFTDALTYATRALRADEGVRALIPVAVDSSGATGFDLADYLEQQLTRARRTLPVPDNSWRALHSHTHQADALTHLAHAAEIRGRYIQATALRFHAGATGNSHALIKLAQWLEMQGFPTEAESTYRCAAATGDQHALSTLLRRLATQGREVEIEQALHNAGTAENPDTLTAVAEWLTRRGREREAEQSYRRAAATGNPRALLALAQWLSRRKNIVEAEQAYRAAAATGDKLALRKSAKWLARRGHLADAETSYRRAAATGDLAAVEDLARWLDSQGRAAEAEQTWRLASSTGNPHALRSLAGRLARQSGRQADAERAYREAIDAGDAHALNALMKWLTEWGRESDAEQVCRDSIKAGHPHALFDLARMLVNQGRKDEAEQTLRDAAESGHTDALCTLAGFMINWGREAEAEQAYRDAATGSPQALFYLARSLATWGRDVEAERAIRDATTAGDTNALRYLIWWLNARGRKAEADAIRQDGVDRYGNTTELGEPAIIVRSGRITISPHLNFPDCSKCLSK